MWKGISLHLIVEITAEIRMMIWLVEMLPPDALSAENKLFGIRIITFPRQGLENVHLANKLQIVDVYIPNRQCLMYMSFK